MLNVKLIWCDEVGTPLIVEEMSLFSSDRVSVCVGTSLALKQGEFTPAGRELIHSRIHHLIIEMVDPDD